MALTTLGAGLLVIGGMMNAVPPVADRLSRISGGKPVLQILVGVISAVVGIALVLKVV